MSHLAPRSPAVDSKRVAHRHGRARRYVPADAVLLRPRGQGASRCGNRARSRSAPDKRANTAVAVGAQLDQPVCRGDEQRSPTARGIVHGGNAVTAPLLDRQTGDHVRDPRRRVVRTPIAGRPHPTTTR